MPRTLALALAAAVLAAAAAVPARPAAPACPRPPKAIARPNMLGPFPTPRGYFYTSAKKVKGVVVVSGYSNTPLATMRWTWFNVIAGSERWKVDYGPAQGNSALLLFHGFDDATKGQVALTAVCKSRTTAVLHIRFG
ncbi:MAG TPA: hypothetical protein VI408_07130 [Gaiellaceae bacterium]